VKEFAAYHALDDSSKRIVHKAFAHGWNSAVKSFLPSNSLSEEAFSLGQEINKVIADFENEPDRSVAIIGCAFVDEALQTAITSAVVDDVKASKIVEKNLQSYSIRSQLGFCLGFFPKDSLADFEVLGRIRNQFAHRRCLKSFTDPEMQEYCSKLRTVRAIEGWTETDPRKCFIAAITVALTHRAQMEPQRLSWGNIWEPGW
jgi:DNA-binding MltR family transcriptional regulator